MRALSTASTGMMAMELNVQVIANNLANMTTTGYKRQRAEFQDLLYDHVSRIGTQTSAQGNILPVGIDLGSGVKSVGTPRLMTQGTLSQTGGTLDVAIRGDGFFKIQLPDGTYAYTRDGSFQMDATGRIVTAQGQVSIVPQGGSTPTVLGQITLTRFINQAGLLPVGDNMYTETPASGTPQDGIPNTDGAGDLQQASLEQSNVDSVTEITNLIAAQRAYEMNGKVITAADQMLQSTSSLMR